MALKEKLKPKKRDIPTILVLAVMLAIVAYDIAIMPSKWLPLTVFLFVLVAVFAAYWVFIKLEEAKREQQTQNKEPEQTQNEIKNV
jgi:membrane protein implicated in regulation of membrane protease activity